jgi:predicted MFS family arabinose efflux permease
VRVWGTLGFIAANIVILATYPWGGLPSVPFIAVVISLLAMGNARSFPHRPPPRVDQARSSDHPTRAAWRLVRQPRIALLLLGLGCVFASYMAYYGFYPLYLT